MKISFVVTLSTPEPQAVIQDSWEQMFKLTSALGFDGVELAIRDPNLIDIFTLQSMLEKYKLKLSAIGTGQAYVEEKLSLTSEQETIRAKTIERLKKQIDLAETFNSQVIIGLIRGKLGGNTKQSSARFSFFYDSILELAGYAYKKRVCLLIEPLNRYECDFLNRADQVVELISKINCPGIAILLDTFHMNIEEKKLDDAIICSQAFLKHMHIADSNRCYPGSGHLDFSGIVSTLKKIDYNEFLSGEILPLPNLATVMKRYLQGMNEVLSE